MICSDHVHPKEYIIVHTSWHEDDCNLKITNSMSVFHVKIDQGIGGQNKVVHYMLILPEEKDMLLFFCKLR